MAGHARGQITAIAIAAAVTVPGIALRVSGTHATPWLAAVLFGLAIVGSAFLLAWAAEALQIDVSQGLALAVLALIAVLPEYARILYRERTAFVHLARDGLRTPVRDLVHEGALTVSAEPTP